MNLFIQNAEQLELFIKQEMINVTNELLVVSQATPNKQVFEAQSSLQLNNNSQYQTSTLYNSFNDSSFLETIKKEQHPTDYAINQNDLYTSQKNYTSNDSYSTSGNIQPENGKKEFACDHCNYKAAYKHHLTTHITAVHEKLKSFECGKCNYASSQKSNLNSHLKRVHN